MQPALDASTTRNPRHAAYPAVSSFIDGTWASERAARYVDVLDPATGTAITALPLVETFDLDRALAAANRAFATWRKVPAIERTRLLLAAADLMRQRLDRIAHALVLEQGKTIAGARFEVGAAIESLEWHAEEARRIYGRVIPARAAGVQHIVTRVPVGVVAAFTPWNFPALTPMRKIAGALAAGCTLLIKGAEEIRPHNCLRAAIAARLRRRCGNDGQTCTGEALFDRYRRRVLRRRRSRARCQCR